MVVGKQIIKPWVLILFILFSFGTGFVLVVASQRSTEDRSRASGAYGNPCFDACSAASGGVGSDSCRNCMSANGLLPTPMPTLSPGSGCSEDADYDHPRSCLHCSGNVYFYNSDIGQTQCGQRPKATPTPTPPLSQSAGSAGSDRNVLKKGQVGRGKDVECAPGLEKIVMGNAENPFVLCM